MTPSCPTDMSRKMLPLDPMVSIEEAAKTAAKGMPEQKTLPTFTELLDLPGTIAGINVAQKKLLRGNRKAFKKQQSNKDLSTLFDDLSLSNDKPSLKEMEDSIFFKPKKKPNAAAPIKVDTRVEKTKLPSQEVNTVAPLKADRVVEEERLPPPVPVSTSRDFVLVPEPTPQQKFYAGSESRKTKFTNKLFSDRDIDHGTRGEYDDDLSWVEMKGFATIVGDDEDDEDYKKEVPESSDDESSPRRAIEAFDPYPLPALSEKQIDDLQMELNLKFYFIIDEGFPESKQHDPLRMQLRRREMQLEATSSVHVRKRTYLSGVIKDLEDRLWLDE